MTSPSASDELNRLYVLALSGNREAIETFLLEIDRYVQQVSRLNGKPSEDLAQDVRLELYLEMIKQSRMNNPE